MTTARALSFLRRVLLVDAVAAAAMGVGMLTLAPWLGALLGLPQGLLREAGILLLPFAGFVGFLASREAPPRAGVWAVIALNAVWVVDSVALLFAGWVAPNGAGYGFVIAQALAVLALAELEYIGLRRASLAR
jgi:hypothetical protein